MASTIIPAITMKRVVQQFLGQKTEKIEVVPSGSGVRYNRGVLSSHGLPIAVRFANVRFQGKDTVFMLRAHPSLGGPKTGVVGFSRNVLFVFRHAKEWQAAEPADRQIVLLELKEFKQIFDDVERISSITYYSYVKSTLKNVTDFRDVIN